MENPMTSLIRLTFSSRKPKRNYFNCGNEVTCFQACLHGGKRNKRCKFGFNGINYHLCRLGAARTTRTFLVAQQPKFQKMSATAEERKYPFLFCKILQKIVVERLAPELSSSGGTKVTAETQPRQAKMRSCMTKHRCPALDGPTNRGQKHHRTR
eukprot:9647749-Karenia_brevis.AAC.1